MDCIESLLLDHKQPVTYKLLSRKANIPSNKAKRLLQEFAKSPSAANCLVYYYIQSKSTTNHHDDGRISNQLVKVQIVAGDDALAETKKSFGPTTTLSSMHVYAIQQQQQQQKHDGDGDVDMKQNDDGGEDKEKLLKEKNSHFIDLLGLIDYNVCLSDTYDSIKTCRSIQNNTIEYKHRVLAAKMTSSSTIGSSAATSKSINTASNKAFFNKSSSVASTNTSTTATTTATASKSSSAAAKGKAPLPSKANFFSKRPSSNVKDENATTTTTTAKDSSSFTTDSNTSTKNTPSNTITKNTPSNTITSATITKPTLSASSSSSSLTTTSSSKHQPMQAPKLLANNPIVAKLKAASDAADAAAAAGDDGEPDANEKIKLESMFDDDDDDNNNGNDVDMSRGDYRQDEDGAESNKSIDNQTTGKSTRRVKKKRKVIKKETYMDGKYMRTKEIEVWEEYSEEEEDRVLTHTMKPKPTTTTASSSSNKASRLDSSSVEDESTKDAGGGGGGVVKQKKKNAAVNSKPISSFFFKK